MNIRRKKIRLKRIGSTNEYAYELLNKDGCDYEALIVAEEQYAGKGQDNNSWESEKGMNLTFTIIDFPDYLKAEDQFFYNMAISLGISDFINAMAIGCDAKIKWPNDIYTGMRKIGGVLIQSSVQGNYMKHFITGIGININQQLFLSDAPNPVSLTQLTGKFYKLESCLKKCTGFIDLRLEDLKTGNYKSLREEYHQRLFRINEYHPFSLKEKQIIGMIKGVNHYGQLLLVSRDDQMLTLNMKDVKYVL